MQNHSALAMQHSATYGIDMPIAFPEVQAAEFKDLARETAEGSTGGSLAWTEFAGASNLIAWRFRSALESWHKYQEIEAIKAKTHEDYYQQECLFFNMFASAVSCIESSTYAIAAILSHDSMLSMPFNAKEQKNCSPYNLHTWLLKSNNQKKVEVLEKVFKSLLASDEWNRFQEIRNRLSHRSNLPRHLFASVGCATPAADLINYGGTTSTKKIEASLSDFDALVTWLSKTLCELLNAGIALMSTRQLVQNESCKISLN